ncbi:MAG: hypothetical protein EB015_12710 [Methylocystaceae bacterium]|nr:hypothetical protein [Methylocystaceae bacterium]
MELETANGTDINIEHVMDILAWDIERMTRAIGVMNKIKNKQYLSREDQRILSIADDAAGEAIDMMRLMRAMDDRCQRVVRSEQA